MGLDLRAQAMKMAEAYDSGTHPMNMKRVYDLPTYSLEMAEAGTYQMHMTGPQPRNTPGNMNKYAPRNILSACLKNLLRTIHQILYSTLQKTAK